MRTHERGEGIVESVVATAIVAIAIGAVLSGVLAATHRFGAAPVDRALRAVVSREMHVALDVLKYQGGSIAPTTIATTAPLPGGSPIPIQLSITGAPAAGGYTITVQASADGGDERASMSGRVPQPVPLPSSEIPSPARAAAPI